MDDVIKACASARTKDGHVLQVRLFIVVVFNHAIFTTATNYLSAKNLTTVSDIKKLVTTNWCEKLIAHMTRCLKTFDETRRVYSLVSFVVSIFEIFFS